MQLNVQVRRRAEALNQRHRAALTLAGNKPRRIRQAALEHALAHAPTGYGVAIKATATICALCAIGVLAFALVQGSRRRFVLVVGIALLYGLETLGPRTRAALGVAAVVAGALLVNIAPEDPYFETMVSGLSAGQLSNLHGLLRTVSAVWPVIAIVWFARRAMRAPR